MGAITKIAFVIERNHKATYYGRTAHLILLCDPSYEIKKLRKMFQEFGIFLKAIQPNVDLEDMTSMADRYYELKSQREKILVMLLAESEQIIKEEDLKPETLFSALKIIDSLSPLYISLLSNLSRMLQLQLSTSS